MCGIAGIVLKKSMKSFSFQRFEDSVSLMSHRGPDFFGIEKRETLALYHYRLSIIDLSVNANQPFLDKPQGNCLIYNGEIYNYRELKSKFSVETKTSSDTEVLYKLLGVQGWKVLPDLNGIFSFAYLNKGSNTLSLVRDRLGVKPLYYIDHPDFFAFSSEAKVIMNYIESFNLNWKAFHEFLWYGSTISNQTIVEGIKKLPPGSRLELDLTSFAIKEESFWSVEKDIIEQGVINDSYEVAKLKARELLEKGVERQCISDVPVGAYLSGGVDSSVVVALASQNMERALNTYSVSFDKNPNSELPLARMIAKKYNTNHFEFEVSTKNLEDDLSSLVFQYDEPFADPAAIPLHLMAEQNKNSSKVVLQGDGGDELFAGYGRHLEMSDLFRRRFASKILSFSHPNKHRRESMKYKSAALNAKHSWERMALLVANNIRIEPSQIIASKYNNKIMAENAFDSYQIVDSTFTNQDSLQKMLYTDMQVILPHTYMEKVDKVNMLHSIEARVPLLDNELVNYVMRLPSSYKIRKGVTKSFFRDMVSDLLPREILEGRKVSFGTPIEQWLRTTLYVFVKSLFKESSLRWGELLDIPFLIKLLDRHKLKDEGNGILIWRSVNLLLWLNLYSDKINLD